MKPLISGNAVLHELGRIQNRRGVEVEHPWEQGIAKPLCEIWYVYRGEGRVRGEGDAWQPIHAGMMVWFRRGRLYEWRQHPERPMAVNFFHFSLIGEDGEPFDDSGMPETVDVMDPVFVESLSRRIIELHWEVYHELVVIHGRRPESVGAPLPRFIDEPEPVRKGPFLPDPMGIEAPRDPEAHPVLQQSARLFRSLVDEYQHLAESKLSLNEVGLQLFHRRTICELVARIHEDLAKAPTVTGMAAQCGYTLDHFGRVFRKIMGCGAQEFVMRARLARARQLLLESGLSVKQIAAEVGYGNPFFLSRQFKAIFGESPTAFRHRHLSARGGLDGAPPVA